MTRHAPDSRYAWTRLVVALALTLANRASGRASASQGDEFIPEEARLTGCRGSYDSEIEFVVARAEDTSTVVDGLAAGRIPERVTHNDTKLNNVMIDDRTGALGASYFDKKHTPTMGGLMILTSLMVSMLLWMDLTSPLVIAMMNGWFDLGLELLHRGRTKRIGGGEHDFLTGCA